jgi:RNA polymerase sigma-B factor
MADTQASGEESRSLDELLEALASERETAGSLREEVLARATPILSDVIAKSFPNTGFDAEELFRAGYLGLMNAVHNFELAHGKPFREYAENLIKGEIREHIRDRVRKLEVPAWMKDLNRQLEAAEARLLREKGELPTLTELSRAVNITEEGIAEIFKAREALSYVSLDAEQRASDPAPEIDYSRIRSLQPVPLPVEIRIRLAAALEKLAGLQETLCHSLFRPGDG